MRDCDGVLDWLLQAEPSELAEPPSAARRHLAECRSCWERVREVERGCLALSESLRTEERAFAEEAAVRVARIGVRTRRARARRLPLREWLRSAARPRRRAWRRSPAALAAGLALLLLLRAPTEPLDPVLDLAATVEPEIERGLSVEAPADGRVAVFRTRDPRIHVVWIY